MVDCEVCGSKDATRKAKIEGVILRVCDRCVKLGEEIPVLKIEKKKKILSEIEPYVLVKDFNIIIRNERQKRNLTQEEFAKKMNEKLSVIKRIEDGWQPPENILHKIERFLNIKLLQNKTEIKISQKTGNKNITIGDIVEVN